MDEDTEAQGHVVGLVSVEGGAQEVAREGT